MKITFLSLAIALISGASLAYEVLLMRLFSIIQWHHFAYMIISLALLGYGISGLCLALLRDWLVSRFERVFPAAVLLFGLSAPGCFWLAQRIPFNPAEIFWAPQQLPFLFLLYLLLTIPFFFAASTVGLALYRYREQVSGIYAADLTGAGLGSLAVIGLLFLIPPERALVLLSLAAVIGLVPFYWVEANRRRLGLAACLAVSFMLLAVPERWQTLNISPYKELRQSLRIPGTRIIDRFSSPIGYVHVTDNPRIPLRHAPGLSLNADVTLPPQRAVFIDADNMSAITHFDGNPATVSYLDQTTSALPFHLRKPEHLLILGAGTGADLLQARLFNIETIDAVELNSRLLDYLRDKQDAFSGRIFSAENIRWHVGEARGFVSASMQQFDMIQISLLDAFGASSAGLYALSENYLYTVEALQEYLRHLKPQGYLAITRWIKMPPRDNLKLFATAITALKNTGRQEPGQQLIMIRGWQTGTLLIKNGEVTRPEIETLKKFCDERSFDIDYYPGITEAETNLYNIVPEPSPFHSFKALLSPLLSDRYMDDYKFDIRPATDDKPYFFKFFKWTTLPEIASLYGQGGLSLLESGYIVLIAGALQALLACALFIGLPLWKWKDKLGIKPRSGITVRFTAFFFCLGLAFLFIEIAFIQKFILFLHHPVYSVAVVLSSFLIAAGTGSYASRLFVQHKNGHWYPILGIAITALLYLGFLKELTALLLHQPPWLNIVVSILLTAPLGLFMGMPFPLGLTRMNRLNQAMIPWAWGINGFASVISAMLATLIAMHWGFNILILSAVGLYLLAGMCLSGINNLPVEVND
ncbi:MAG: spermine/spermidine synthase domain-containing protein [Methylosarcina sp.]